MYDNAALSLTVMLQRTQSLTLNDMHVDETGREHSPSSCSVMISSSTSNDMSTRLAGNMRFHDLLSCMSKSVSGASCSDTVEKKLVDCAARERALETALRTVS